MQRPQNITKMSTSHGIEYESYLLFKSTLPKNLTDEEILQLRWMMTHASYFVSKGSIFIVCDCPTYKNLIKQAFLFVDADVTICEVLDELCDMVIVFDETSKPELEKYYTHVKPNGFMVLQENIEFEARSPTFEICGLKILRKSVQKEDVDFNVHIFIPVHNGIVQTLRCLQSIYRQTIIDALKITVIDDGSSDGTAQLIEEKFSDVSIIAGDGALWWTGAINKALQTKQHIFNDGDYFLLINSDVVLNPNTIFSLIEDAVQDRSLCVAPIGFTCDESIACGEADDGHIFYRFEQSSKVMMQNNNLYSVLSLFGRCTLFPVEILKMVDNFDAATFPHYYGDADFCLRAKKFGYKFKISGKTSIRVQHDTETTGAHHGFFSKRRTLKEVYSYLTDIKSLGSIKYRWRFYSRHYPQQKYTDLLNTIIKGFRQIGYKE